MTYTKGQSWYELPKKPHIISRNASVAESAKLLVLLLSHRSTTPILPRVRFVWEAGWVHFISTLTWILGDPLLSNDLLE
jgi:hypothetical protein